MVGTYKITHSYNNSISLVEETASGLVVFRPLNNATRGGLVRSANYLVLC